MTFHHLFALGAPLLLTEAGEQVRFRTRKHLALLIRLALEPGKRLSRDHLMELLWPDVPPRLARHSLAQALSVLRAKVGREHLQIQRATVALTQGAVDLDVHRLGSEGLEVRGRFLEGFEIPGVHPFEQWKDEWHARLSPKIRDTLVRQMDAARRIGDFETVERRAQALLDLDPACEDAVRGLMEARAYVGDRTNALKAFARYEGLIAREFEAKPAADLVRMAGLLREGRRSSPHTKVAEQATPTQRRFEGELLLGREAEFSGLYDAWMDVRNRASRVVVLLGDPGMGKTTLANAFASSCQMEGAVIARAQAYDAERDLPFAVLAELVRQLTAQRAIGAAEPDALSELARVVPEIFAAFPGVPKPLEWSPEVTPLRLADALLKAIVAAAEDSPLLLIVDDVHSTDNASAAILHVVARKLATSRVLLILTARPSELRIAAAPAALVSDATIAGVRTLELDALGPEVSQALVAAVARGSGVGAGMDQLQPPTERILRASSGNPLAIALLTREWAGGEGGHGQTSLLQDLEALNTNPAATVGIPRAIGTVFERQLRRLDTTGRSVLDLAAVLGRRLAELALYEVVALPTAAAAQALSRLRDEGFLREVGGEIEFRNELIRAQAYYAVAGKVRQHLHGRVALQLAKAEGEDGPPNLEVAWHFLRAGDSRGAIPYALNGAERAITVGGPREAEQVLEALLHAQMDEGTATKAKLLLAKALMEQSKGGAAIPILLLLKSIPVLSILDRAEVTGLLATALYLANDEKANEAASEALESARQAGDISLLAQALFAFARAGIEEGKSERVEQALRECEALLALPSGNEEPMVLYTRAYCEFHYSFDAERADQDLQRAIAILGDSASPTKLSRFCSGVGHCKLVKLELDAAQYALTRAMDLALRVGDDSRASVIANAKCAVEAVRGDVTQAIGLARWSLDLGRRALNQPSLIGIYMNLADLYALAGQHDLETEAIHKAHSLLEAPHSWWAEVDFFLHLASCALIHGNTPMALQQASEAERLIGGREHAVQDASIMYKFRVFRTLHLHGPDEALQEADAALRLFRGKNPLYYYNVLVSKAWAERIALGENLGETLDELRAFASRPVMGVRTISIAQGFIRE